MEKNPITVAKIVATAKDTSWAHSYSAGKLYIVLSLEGTNDTTLASLGKDTLEKLQREFFALDEKTLSSIKKASETVTTQIPEGVALSLVLGTVVEGVLYLILVNNSSVIIKRNGLVSVLTRGTKNETTAISGNFKSDDIYAFLTNGFLHTVAFKDISASFEADTANEIGETLAPFLHENATGTEAALVLKITGHVENEETSKDTDTLPIENNDHLELEENDDEEAHHSGVKIPSLPKMSLDFKKYIPQKFSKKHVITAAIIVLLLCLVGGIFFENTKRQEKTYNTELSKILTPNKQKLEDALAVMSLNKSLAVEELQEIKADVASKRSLFPDGSSAQKELDAFLAQVDGALGGESSNGNSIIKVFFDGQKNQELGTILGVTQAGGELIVMGNKKGANLSSDGALGETFDGVTGTKGLTADENNIYALSSGSVEKIEKGNGNTSTIIEGQAIPISIATFGGNIYLLSKTDKSIYKYRPSSFAKENYFTDDTKLVSPSSIAIDSSIFVIDNGKVKKFTRGAEDTFTYGGPNLSTNAQIYTDIDYANLYIVDPTKKQAIVIDKSGNTINEISLKGMKSITGVTANEKDKKMYIVADNKIYSADF